MLAPPTAGIRTTVGIHPGSEGSLPAKRGYSTIILRVWLSPAAVSL
jgi:hypothetical protein